MDPTSVFTHRTEIRPERFNGSETRAQKAQCTKYGGRFSVAARELPKLVRHRARPALAVEPGEAPFLVRDRYRA